MARKKEFDQTAVLKKAANLFWRKGYHDTSIRDLVEYLGLSRSSIYDTFGDKDQLFFAALNLYLQDGSDASPMQVPTDFNLAQFLHHFLHHKIDESLNDPERKGCFAVNCYSVDFKGRDNDQEKETKVKAILQDNMERFVQNMTPVFEQAIAGGQLSKEKEPEKLANYLFATLSSIKLLSRKVEDRKILEDIASMSIEAILN